MKKDPFAEREARNYQNPIASRELILECLTTLGEPTAFKHLAKTLAIEESDDRSALKSRLGAMVRAGQLIVDRRNVYAIASRLELPSGKISAHTDGYGFLLQEGEDIFLSHHQMRQVFHGDIARVRVRSRDRRGRMEGEIVEVIERNTRQLVGRYYVKNNVDLLEPLNNRVNHEILLVKDDAGHYEEGQILVAEIVEQPSSRGEVLAKVTQILGDHLTPGIEVEIALRNNDIPTELSDELIDLVDRLPSEVRPKDKLNRFDLTELPFVTIDGEDARDFDDAVYCEPKASGGWRLYVAIADVSEYVEPESLLDQSAYQRGTSVYFPQYVVPMLPEKLSNGLCSLKPKVERLVLVCEMTISAKGKVSGYQFYEGTIYSHARLTYTQVAEVVTGEKTGPMRVALSDILPHLDELHLLYLALAEVRQQRGAIDFDTTELQFEFAKDGSVQNILPRTRNIAHKIIEECMLCANVCAAKFITKFQKPGLFRVHEPPKEEKVEFLKEFLARFNISLNVDEAIQAADYQEVVQALRDRENGHVLQIALLRSMNQAVYQPQNEGHFGLGFAEYTHFTSPIRRYPDLLTHRLIKSLIHSDTKSKLHTRPGKRDTRNYYPYSLEQVLVFGEQTSFAERRADSAVYEVLEWVKCDYASDRVGDVLEGVITGVAKFGFFVELSDIFVEGLVHISSLNSEYFHFDQGAQCLVGEKNNLVYGLGDTVQVRIARVNVDERKLDFELVAHSPLSDRQKPSAKKASARKPKPKKASGDKSGGAAKNTREKGRRKKTKARSSEGFSEESSEGDKNKQSGKMQDRPKSASKRPSKKHKASRPSSKSPSSKNLSSRKPEKTGDNNSSTQAEAGRQATPRRKPRRKPRNKSENQTENKAGNQSDNKMGKKPRRRRVIKKV